MKDKLQVNVMDGNKVAKSYAHPRVIMAVMAAQIGMSTAEIQSLLSLSDQDLQARVDEITAKLNKLKESK